ncbi:MAG: FGGY-family carbohydrate kinase [Terriglobales bacterium]
MSLLAIDMGSSSCKAAAFSDGGRILASQAYSYLPTIPRPSWAEISPHKFWEALQTVIRAVASETERDPIEVLSISAHGETFVPVDSNLQPIGAAILNMDNRAVAQSDWLSARLGRACIFEITGLTPHPMYPIPKILWLRENQKETYYAAAKLLGVADYLLTRLDLPAYIDYSHASRFLAFDIRQRCWSEKILSACDLRPDQFSAAVPAGTVAGRLTSATANHLGLPGGVLVVVGGHDQPCAALASAVAAMGSACASLGTYECLLTGSEKPSLNDIALGANLNTSCHVVPDRFVTLAYFPAGVMLEWFVRLLHQNHPSDGTVSASEEYAALDSQAPEGPSGLCITPHLFGTCNPDFNPKASGVILGIRPSTTRSDIYKGILEGIAFEFTSMTELLQRVSGPFESISVTGGGCRSRLGLKLRASLAGRPLQLMQCPDAVCLGTAILASVAAGKYAGFPEAMQNMVKAGETIHPDPALAEAYRAQLNQYRLLYSSLSAVREAQAAS